MQPTRRRLLGTAAAGVGAGLTGCAGGGPDEDDDDAPEPSGGDSTTTATDDPGDGTGLPAAVGLETLVEGLRAPLDVAFT